MDKKTVFIKTAKGEREGANLSSDLKRILSLIDNKSRADELAKRAPPSLREEWMEILEQLVEDGYIRDKNKTQVEPKIAKPKASLLKMFTPKPSDAPMEELDYNTPYAAPVPSAAEQAALRKSEEAARIRSEMEAAVAAAKNRTNAEAHAKAEAKARLEAENAAHAKALIEAEAASKAEYKAQKEAESAARAKAAADAKAKQEMALRAQAEAAEAKARKEAAARMQEQEAARAKAALEAAVRVRAEIEAAARAQQMAEAKVKQEVAARMKAEQEAAQAKAALEAAARAKIEEAARVRAEIEAAARAQQLAEEKARAEENTRREIEAARLKAEQEAAQAKAALEAAAKARIEEEARVRAEIEAARLKAEQEALRMKAELEAAKARAEAEAKALAEALARQAAEEKARQEAEAARIKAEQEAAARILAEAEIKAAAELLARQQVAAAAARREAEERIKRAAELAASSGVAQQSTSAVPAKNTFEINLDNFLVGTEQSNQSFVPAGQYVKQTSTEEEVKAKDDEEQLAAVGEANADKSSTSDAAAEMARLKSEAELARRKLEEEARRQTEEKLLAEEQSKAWEEAEQRAQAQVIIELEQAAQQAALIQAKATQPSRTRKQRKPLPVGKISFSLIALVLVVVIVLPYVYPLNDYIAPLEQRLSTRLKQPVHIGGMSATSLPPKLKLQNMTVGSAKEVKIGSVALNFDPLSLLSDAKVISNAELQDVSIQGTQLDKQVASLNLLGGDAQYPVRHMTLQHVKIATDEIALPVMSGIADLGVQGAFNRVSLHSDDNKLGVDLQPNLGHWQLSLTLKESSLPILPEVVFSDLSAKGDLSDGEVNFTEIDAHIYNGILLGKAKLSWSKGWQLQGSLEAKTFDLDKMFPRYHLDGELFGEGTFSMAGAKLSQMDDDPHLDGSFSVKTGTFNIDMVETARLMSRENLVGGRTHFDDMIGLVRLENRAIHFRQLKILSGMLSSTGAFDVSAGNKISGNFNAEIKMRAGNNPLTLYGTLDEQKLRAGN